MVDHDDRHGTRGGDPDDHRDSAAVFDIDGVLADVRHRLHHVTHRSKDWDAFFGAASHDPPLHEGLGVVATAERAGPVVVYLTGRPERCRRATLDWLADQGLPPGDLFMRGDSDRRPARLTKVAALRRLSRHYRIETFVDDDAVVVDAVRRAGFRALHAQWMETSTSGVASDSGVIGTGSSTGPQGSSSAGDVLFEIQESEGRT